MATATDKKRRDDVELGQVETNFYGMKKYADKVERALRDGGGPVEIGLTDSWTMCQEVVALRRALHRRGVGVVSLDHTYAFLLDELKLSRGYTVVERLGQVVRQQPEPWMRWLANGYQGAAEAVERAKSGDPSALGEVCKFLETVYRDRQYDSPLVDQMRREIEDTGLYLDFSRERGE